LSNNGLDPLKYEALKTREAIQFALKNDHFSRTTIEGDAKSLSEEVVAAKKLQDSEVPRSCALLK
jgi:hypothetical protein